jgi:hypothetical protein
MTHDQVRELVRRINPIPDPSVLETVDVPVPRLERSMDMQVDDRQRDQEHRSNRWRGPLIGIAAAAVVLIVGVIYIYTSRDPVAAPAPNATELPGEFQPIAPGAYFADTDGNEETATRGTFVIEGSGWQSVAAGAMKDTPEGVDNGLYVGLMIVEVDRVWEAPCDGGASVPAGTAAKALGDQFAAMPEFITREGLTPVSAFGRDGYHLVLEVPGGCTGGENVWTGRVWGDRNYQAEGQIVEYWFLDVEGTTVMVEATRPPESGEENVTELTDALDTLLDTLVVTP